MAAKLEFGALFTIGLMTFVHALASLLIG